MERFLRRISRIVQTTGTHEIGVHPAHPRSKTKRGRTAPATRAATALHCQRQEISWLSGMQPNLKP